MAFKVSMKSGLRDRNNVDGHAEVAELCQLVSMKSGLGDRNNHAQLQSMLEEAQQVSMKSGLGDRNNAEWTQCHPGITAESQ